MKKEDIKKFLKEKYDFICPDWWECQWIRNACGRAECPLCGRIMKQHFKHQFKGENPESEEAFFQDIKDSFEEAIFLLNENAEKEGINLNQINEDIAMPPEPDEFPEHKKYRDWILGIHHFAEEKGLGWIETEAGHDLMWYSNLIPAKVYRNLCNRWYLEKGQTDENIDYYYTRYVLENCIRIIKESFETVISMRLPQKNELICLYNQFLNFEKEILSI
jgi:hypothetical protein